MRLFSYSGIPVYAHYSMWFFFVMLALGGAGSLTGLAVGMGKGFMLFGIVLAHEFAHALTAQRLGFKVDSITLMILGGLAKVDELDLATPRQEALISLAGPALNIVLAGVAYVLYLVLGLGFSGPLISVLAFFITVNIMLGAFNILPVFPMDGGRVTRAILSSKLGVLRGTQYTWYVTCFMSSLLFVAGLIFGRYDASLIMLIMLFSAYSEYCRVRKAHKLTSY